MKTIFYLLKLEWLKIRSYRPFLILLGFFVATLPLFTYVFDSMKGQKALGNPLAFPLVWHSYAYLCNWLTFFVVGFWSILTVTNEFSDRTLRQNIINGISRANFFWSKVLFLAILCLTLTTYYFVVAGIIGFFNTETTYFNRFDDGFSWAGRLLLLTFLYASLGLFLGLLLRRSGLALFLFFGWAVFLERIVRHGLHRQITNNETMHYYPINASADLVPVPIPKIVEEMSRENGFKMNLSVETAGLVTAIYCVLFLFLAYRLMTRRDL